MAWHKLRSVIAHGRKPIAFTVRPQDTQMYKDASHAQCTQFIYRQNSQRGRTKHRQLPVPDFSREFRVFKGGEQIRELGTKLLVPAGLRTEPWRELGATHPRNGGLGRSRNSFVHLIAHFAFSFSPVSEFHAFCASRPKGRAGSGCGRSSRPPPKSATA